MRKTQITIRFNWAFWHIAILAEMVFLFPSAFGQVVKLKAKPLPQDSGSSLNLSVSSSAVAFSLISQGTATGNDAITISGSVASEAGTSLNIYGYFTSATNALTGQHSGAVIPSSAVLGQVSTGLPVSYTAFTESTPFNGAASGLKLASAPVIGSSFNYSYTLNLGINLNGLVLPADTYTGTLTIQVQDM